MEGVDNRRTAFGEAHGGKAHLETRFGYQLPAIRLPATRQPAFGFLLTILSRGGLSCEFVGLGKILGAS